MSGDRSLRGFLADIGRRGPAPDVTGRVLARLGLARPRSPEARRRRISRGARRVFLCGAAVSAVAGALLLHRAAAATRAPAATVAAAVERQIGRQWDTVDCALEGIRGAVLATGGELEQSAHE